MLRRVLDIVFDLGACSQGELLDSMSMNHKLLLGYNSTKQQQDRYWEMVLLLLVLLVYCHTECNECNHLSIAPGNKACC